MSSRIERERQAIIARISSSGNHSINQHQLKSGLEGEIRMSLPRKVIMAERRKDREREELLEYEATKLGRILSRVLAVKRGEYDGFCEDGFIHEIRYLKTKEIPLKQNS